MKFLSVCLYVGLLFVLVDLNYADAAKKEYYNDVSDELEQNSVDVSDEVVKDEEKNGYGNIKKTYKKKQTDYYDNSDESDEGDESDESDQNDFIYACGKNEKDPICKCENEALNCEMQSLETTNIFISDGSFIPKYVNFKNNFIEILKYKSILPGMDYEIDLLDFSNNFIHKIDNKSFDPFINLKVLRLSSNKLKTISSGFLTIKVGASLHQLFLDNNQIKRIPAFAFRYLRNLRKLVLDGNNGLQLSKDVFPAALSNLETLSLDGCQISRLDEDVFERLTNLKVLSLRNNPISYIPRAINAIPNLVGLDLSGTEIIELYSDQISADHNLTEIRLSNMPYLYGIYDCAFCDLPNLKIVDLSNNSQLYFIHENAFGSIINKKHPVATLKKFDIRYCNFSNLPEKLFDWTKIEMLKINGNPFNCNSDLEWLTKNKNIHFETNPKCAKPLSLKGMYFSNITKSVSQTYWHGFFTLKSAIVLSLTVIGFIALSASVYILQKILYNNVPSRTSGPQYTVLPTKV